MIPRPTTLRLLACVLLSGIAFLHAQNPAPATPPPPVLVKDKAAEAAAAIQPPAVPAPKLLQPAAPQAIQPIPDLATRPSVPAGKGPATLKPQTSPQPAAPMLPPVIRPAEPEAQSTPPPSKPLPAPPPIGSMTKEQALDAATKPRMEGREAPSIPLPSDKLPVTTSTSASGQFRVHNADFELRSRMSSHLDQVARELRDVLHDGDPHVIPINVRLTRGEEAARAVNAGSPPVTVGITEVDGGGFHLQLDIHEAPTLTLALIRQETVRLLLAERILRGHTKITQPQNRLLLPDWIFTGVLQAMDFRAAARPPTMFAAIFQSGKIYGIEEIIAVSPTQMDSLSRGIYETSCGALVMALVDQPVGGRRFNQFLASLNGSSASERDLLTAAYPGFAASASSLNKWWALQMATLAKRSLSDPLTADESLAALEKAITISYPAKPEDVPKDLKKRPFVQPATLFSAPAIASKKPHPDDIAEASGAPRIVEKSSPSKPKETAKPSATAEPKEAEPEAETADASVSKKEGSPWLRYVTFGLMGSTKEGEKSDEPKEDKTDKPKETKATAEVTSADMPPETKDSPKEEKTEPEPSEDSKAGFFSRVFGIKKDPVAESRQKAADEAARVEKEKLAEQTKAKELAEKEAAAKVKAKELADKEAAAKAKAKELADKEAAAKAKAAAEAEMKPAEPEKVAEEKPKEEPKPGFFSRLRSTKKPEAEKPAEEPAPAAEDKKMAEAPKPAEPEKVAEEKPKEEPKPGFFSRLRSTKKPEAEKPAEEPANTDAKKMADEAEAKAKADAEAKAKAEADAKAKALAEKEAKAKADAEKKAAAEKQAEAERKAAAEKKAEAEKKAAAEKEAKKPAKEEPKEEAKDKPAAKPSGLNPLKWFRSKKTSEEPEKTEKEAKDSKPKDSDKPKDEAQASWIDFVPTPIAVVQLHVQPAMELWDLFFPSSSPRHAILDFLKRKKTDEEKAKPAEPEPPKPVEPTPAPAPAKKKKATKSSSTPKTTNPNARPAARPVQPADGSQRTTNPNAKPLVLPKVPTATTPPPSDDNVSTLPAGTVLVEMHVEDYKHLLKNPERAKILQHNIASLRALENRVSVPMRPVVIGYLDVMLALQAGKSGADIDKRLALLREAAVAAAQKTKTVRDYLDFYEANETEKLSGKFEDFLNLPTIIQKELPPREDPIARYLDAIDKEFSK